MGLDLFFPFFFPCLIMNLLFRGRGYVATDSDYGPLLRPPCGRRRLDVGMNWWCRRQSCLCCPFVSAMFAGRRDVLWHMDLLSSAVHLGRG